MTETTQARTEWGEAPSLDDIAAMAREALDTLEEPFKTHAKAVAIKVEDSRQIAADGAWIEIVDQALKDYRAAAAEQTRDRF